MRFVSPVRPDESAHLAAPYVTACALAHMPTKEQKNGMTQKQLIVPGRRGFLNGTAKLSAAAVAHARRKRSARRRARRRAMDSKDVNILNVALGLEWEGINAYTLGAQSGLLQKPVLDTAVRFQADHKEHADTLAGAIRKMGGKPVEPKSLADYAKALKADTLKSQADVLEPRRAPRARRDQRLPRRDPVVQEPGARAGRGAPGRRRGDALDHPQQRARPPAARRRHAVRRVVNEVSPLGLRGFPRRAGLFFLRAPTPRAASSSTRAAASAAIRSTTTAPARRTRACSAARPAWPRASTTRPR